MSADCALTAQMEDEAKRVRGTASSSGAPRLCRLYREHGAMFVKIHGVWLCPGFTSFPSLDKIQRTGQQHSDTLKVIKSNSCVWWSRKDPLISFWPDSCADEVNKSNYRDGQRGIVDLNILLLLFFRSREWLIKSCLQTQIAFEINTSLVMYFLSEKEKIALLLTGR